MKYIKPKYFIFIIFVFLIVSCKTKNGETTKLGKFYHNVTGRYNAYYNANLLLMKGFDAQTQANRDNYNQLLAMYPYTAAEAAAAAKPKTEEKGNADKGNDSNDEKSGKTSDNKSAGDNKSGSSSSGSPLDDAIKKCATNIELHRPSNWADDSYFIIGRAEFLKKDYEKSVATFQYIVNKYHKNKSLSEMSPDELKEYKAEQAEKNKEIKKKNQKKKKKKIKKKKKKPVKKKKKKSTSKGKNSPTTKEKTTTTKDVKTVESKTDKSTKSDEEVVGSKPKNYFLKHRPVRFDAMLWQAKSNIELGNYDEAGRILRLLIEREDVPRRIKAEAHATDAHSYIRQKEYLKAIEPLETALSLFRQKKKKTRFTYVLAQLYQKTENNQKAVEKYRAVLRLNPTYEMEFNARLNMAINAADTRNNKINPELALRRMLREGKNEEYKDQIYFALAQIQLKGGDKEKGIAALQMAMSGGDGFQRTEATYMLADLFYEKEDYVKAYSYYDTCSQTIQKTDERYDFVMQQKKLLKDLAENINATALKDSLLTISALPYEKQKELVQKLRLEEELSKKGGSALEKNAKAQVKATDAGINAAAVNESKFPLYDPNAIKKGEKEFQKRWGNRQLVENWRRADSNNDNDNKKDETAEALKPMTEQEVKDYLKKMNVPLDTVSIKTMNKEIEKAMYMVAVLYREQLGKNGKSKDAFNKLFNRYPNSSYNLESWYTMYNICTEERNQFCSDTYMNKILEKYPQSDIAKSLRDPSFMNAREKLIHDVNLYYEETYAQIKNGNFKQANDRIDNLSTKFGKDFPMKARFAILSAMCKGGQEGIDSYIKALKAVSASFPNTEEDKKAKEMVALLSGNKDNNVSNPLVVKNENDKTTKFPFDTETNTGHYVLVVFNDSKANMTEYKNKVTDFNTKLFNLLRLNVSSLMLDSKLPTLIIRKFKDRKEAEEYLKTADGNKEFLGANASAYKMYFIGQNNYRDVLQKQNFSEYVNFFEQTFNK